MVDNTSYAWSNSQISKGAGLLTSTNDVQNGGATTDTQCFQYDWDQRLSQAWTATDNCAATPANGSSSTVGGVNPYWQSWTYTADGQRSTEIDHDTTGNTANDTTTSYNYPAAGSATDQPHTLSSTTATGPGASAQTANYTYDADGNTLSISGGAAGAQSMTWNDQGKLAGDSSSSGSTSYLYDTDGNLILRTDPGTATLFLGDEQIVENTATASLTATRYYSLGGTSVAERSNTGDVQYLIPDRQGSDTLAIDASAMQAVTRRQYTPFGQVRGTAPASWPGDKGYVGGTTDAATDLENLGAREYDPPPGASSAPTRSWRPPTHPALRLRLCRQRPRHRQRPVGQLCLRRRRHLHEQPTRHRRGRRPAGRVHPAPTRIGRWCRGQRLRGGADQRARFRGGEQPYLPVLQAAWSRAVANMGHEPTNAAEEYRMWTMACVMSPGACSPSMAGAFNLGGGGPDQSGTFFRHNAAYISASGAIVTLTDFRSLTGISQDAFRKLVTDAGFTETEKPGLGFLYRLADNPGVTFLFEFAKTGRRPNGLIEMGDYIKIQLSKALTGGKEKAYRVGAEGILTPTRGSRARPRQR
ncbi:hypothetical protein GXW82_43410 [Streptacidiphilus sp. 4-A2]|nr:hypothetical protein [Streptacidiphilus sp. 4-A2]